MCYNVATSLHGYFLKTLQCVKKKKRWKFIANNPITFTSLMHNNIKKKKIPAPYNTSWARHCFCVSVSAIDKLSSCIGTRQQDETQAPSAVLVAQVTEQLKYDDGFWLYRISLPLTLSLSLSQHTHKHSLYAIPHLSSFSLSLASRVISCIIMDGC